MAVFNNDKKIEIKVGSKQLIKRFGSAEGSVRCSILPKNPVRSTTTLIFMSFLGRLIILFRIVSKGADKPGSSFQYSFVPP